EEAVAGPRLGEFGAHRLLGAMVGGGDEVGRALERDLQLLDLAEVAPQPARSLARGGDHDVEEGGLQHCALLTRLPGRARPRSHGGLAARTSSHGLAACSAAARTSGGCFWV